MAIISRKTRRSRRNKGGGVNPKSSAQPQDKAAPKLKGKSNAFRSEMFRLADRKKKKQQQEGGPKMKVGKAGDRFEQEAEAVAASVVDRDGAGTAVGNVLSTSQGLNRMEEEKPAQSLAQKAEEPEAQAAEEEMQKAEEPEAQTAIQKGGGPEEEESSQGMMQKAEEPEAQAAEDEMQKAEEPEAQTALQKEEEEAAAQGMLQKADEEGQMAEDEMQKAEEPEAQAAIQKEDEEEASQNMMQKAEEPEAQAAEEEAQQMEGEEAQKADDEAQALVQKKGDCQVPSEEFTDAVRLAKQDGRPLPTEIRHQMETAFGADFSQVRVHTDAEAARLSAALGAQAFTNGNHIFFNMGKFDPSTSKGRHLLAHELTHTLQQGAVERKSVLTGSARVTTRKKEEEEEEPLSPPES